MLKSSTRCLPSPVPLVLILQQLANSFVRPFLALLEDPPVQIQISFIFLPLTSHLLQLLTWRDSNNANINHKLSFSLQGASSVPPEACVMLHLEGRSNQAANGVIKPPTEPWRPTPADHTGAPASSGVFLDMALAMRLTTTSVSKIQWQLCLCLAVSLEAN